MKVDEDTFARTGLTIFLVLGTWKLIELLFLLGGLFMSLEVALVLGGTTITLALIFFAGWWLNQTNAYEPRATRNRLKATAESIYFNNTGKMIELESKTK